MILKNLQILHLNIEQISADIGHKDNIEPYSNTQIHEASYTSES